jgi:hypothetical protein
MSALQPTPETDALHAKQGLTHASYRDFARKLERERDSAKTLNRLLLDQLEAQATLLEAVRHERDNTWEKLEAMREAIKDAHYALDYVYNHGEGSCAFPYRTDDDLCSENRFHHVKDALDALKPLIKP